MNTRKIGSETEARVCDYLVEKGYRIIERNWSCSLGEIDIIALKNGVMSFIEVKKMPLVWDEADIGFKVNHVKMLHIKRTAACYLAQSKIIKYDGISFDVVTVSGTEIKSYEGAF